jgi:hypothetical protein
MLREDAESLIRTDDTTVPLLAKDKTRTGRLWTYVRRSHPLAVTRRDKLWQPSRTAAVHRSTPVTANSCNRLGILELSECADCERPDLPKRPAKQSLQSSPRPVG